MRLSWQPPNREGASRISGYIIEKREDGHAWVRVDHVSRTTNSITVNNLSPGATYWFKVTAENVIGRGESIEVKEQIKSINTSPSPPSHLRLIGVSESSMTIEWNRPISDGGSLVTGYVIEIREDIDITWRTVGRVSATTTSLIIQDLRKKSTNHVRVAAENEEGIGEFSEIKEKIVLRRPKSVPGCPSSLSAEVLSEDTVVLRWLPPLDTGDVPLSGYLIEQETISGSWVLTAYVDQYRTSYTVQGLSRSQSYNFRVKAENVDGTSEACLLSESIRPRPLVWRPGAPSQLEVNNIYEDSVELTWFPPLHDGGARVTSYMIEMKDESRAEGWIEVHSLDAHDTLSSTIEGLHLGKPYLFRVSAVNSVGAGPPASLPSAVTPRAHQTIPGSPQGPLRVIRVTRNMLALHWRPPADTGGTKLERYVIEQREAESSQWEVAGACCDVVCAFCVTCLKENQAYHFRVRAENGYGKGEALETRGSVTPSRVCEEALQIDSYVQESLIRSSSYSTYSDEPLTVTRDTLDVSWLHRV
jgi:titin